MAILPGRGAIPPKLPVGAILPARIQGGQVGLNQTGSPVLGASVKPGRAPRAPVTILTPGPALRRQQTDDRQANASAEAARTSTGVAKANPKGLSILLEGLTLVNGANIIAHGLGRPFRGANLVSSSASVTWHIQRASGIPADAYQITVTVSGNVVADLEVWA